MSSTSLPQLLNGGGLSYNPRVNRKFATLSRLNNNLNKNNKDHAFNSRYSLQSVGHNNKNNNHIFDEQYRRHQLLRQKRGSFHGNLFRGAKREDLEMQASIIIYSMTVRNFYLSLFCTLLILIFGLVIF